MTLNIMSNSLFITQGNIKQSRISSRKQKSLGTFRCTRSRFLSFQQTSLFYSISIVRLFIAAVLYFIDEAIFTVIKAFKIYK